MEKNGGNYAVTIVKNGDSAANPGDVFAAAETKSLNDKTISRSAVMPDEKNGVKTDGKYVLYVKGKNTQIEQYPFDYVTEDGKNAARNELMTASEAELINLLSSDSEKRAAHISCGLVFDTLNANLWQQNGFTTSVKPHKLYVFGVLYVDSIKRKRYGDCMKGKILRMTFTACMLLAYTTGVHAVDINVENKTIIVEEKFESESECMMVAVKADGDLSCNDDIFAVRYAVANGGGKAVFSFDMPDERNGISVDGDYDIYTKQVGKVLEKTTITYVTEKTRQELTEKLKQCSKWEEIINNPENLYALKAIGCRMDEYLGSADKKDIVSFITDYTENIEDIDSKNFAAAFNKAIYLVSINKCEKSQVNNIIGLLNMKFEDKVFADIENAKEKDWLTEYIFKNRPYKSITEFEDAYKKANELYIINNAREDKIKAALDTYANDLELLSSTEYNNYLKLKNHDKANENIAAALKKNPAYSTKELMTVIGDAVKSVSGNKVGNSGGSSGGGTSKSNVTGISSSIPTEPRKETVQKTVFFDLDDAAWAVEAVSAMAEMDIVSGDENGNFRPNDTIKREEFVKMLVAAADAYDENAECSFDDVLNDAWYYRSIASAYKSGLVYGIDENTFGVGNDITRQDMMVLCKRAAEGRITLEKTRDYKAFSDDSEIADYAKEAVAELYMSGIANGMGDDMFCPTNTATRAQGAVIIYNLFIK